MCQLRRTGSLATARPRGRCRDRAARRAWPGRARDSRRIGPAPADIRSGPRPTAASPIKPLGIAAHSLGPTARALLGQLVALYLDRLPPELAAEHAARAATGDLHFAWEGPQRPGTRNYYRIQGDDLLIEYDNTDDGNHAHTVLRRPHGDFGEDILAVHYAQAHQPASRNSSSATK